MTVPAAIIVSALDFLNATSKYPLAGLILSTTHRATRQGLQLRAEVKQVLILSGAKLIYHHPDVAKQLPEQDHAV